MEDIAPALLEALQNAFLRNLAEDQKGAALLETIRSGNGTYATAGDYAEQIGAALAKAFREHLGSDVLPDGKMYWNIADRVVRPLLEDAYRQTSAAAYQVQKALNEAAGLGLKALAAPMNNDRVEGILDAITDADRYDDVSFYLAEPVLANFTRSIVDDAVLVNVEFQGRAGLQPKIIRRAERKCCAWCANLAGEYDYPDVPRDVYRRHKNCRCVVEYDPADGKRRRQNVHTKKWTDPQEDAKINTRKSFALLSGNRRRYESDIVIGRSVGAQAKNYTVLDLETGEFFRFAGGTRIQNVEVFAGKGTKKEFRKAQKYADRYGGSPENWQHAKGHGVVETQDGNRKAEVHWVQCEGIGKFDFFVKRWED